jgi:hypothetical protein
VELATGRAAEIAIGLNERDSGPGGTASLIWRKTSLIRRFNSLMWSN